MLAHEQVLLACRVILSFRSLVFVQVPYAGLSGIQAALAVMHRGLRPDIPSHTPAPLAQLIQECWQPLPAARPGFAEIVQRLEIMQSDFGG